MPKGTCFKNNLIICDKLAFAVNFYSRLMGLMFKKTITKGEGLIIPSCRSIHTCFMKFPIDALFLNKEHEIVKIYVALKPWRMTSVVLGAADVLELPENTVAEKDLKVGDKLIINIVG